MIISYLLELVVVIIYFYAITLGDTFVMERRGDTSQRLIPTDQIYD